MITDLAAFNDNRSMLSLCSVTAYMLSCDSRSVLLLCSMIKIKANVMFDYCTTKRLSRSFAILTNLLYMTGVERGGGGGGGEGRAPILYRVVIRCSHQPRGKQDGVEMNSEQK